MALTNIGAVFRNPSPASRPISVMQRLALWRSRRTLAELDARALDDIGISAQEAQREARRGIWDAPTTWTCK